MSNSESDITTDQSGSTAPRSPDEIESELEQTRQDLGETVDALSAKFDVKSRAKEQVAVTKQRASDQFHVARGRAAAAAAKGKDAATDDEGSVKPVVPATAGGVALLVLGVLIVVVRRRRRRPVLVARPPKLSP